MHKSPLTSSIKPSEDSSKEFSATENLNRAIIGHAAIDLLNKKSITKDEIKNFYALVKRCFGKDLTKNQYGAQFLNESGDRLPASKMIRFVNFIGCIVLIEKGIFLNEGPWNADDHNSQFLLSKKQTQQEVTIGERKYILAEFEGNEVAQDFRYMQFGNIICSIPQGYQDFASYSIKAVLDNARSKSCARRTSRAFAFAYYKLDPNDRMLIDHLFASLLKKAELDTACRLEFLENKEDTKVKNAIAAHFKKSGTFGEEARSNLEDIPNYLYMRRIADQTLKILRVFKEPRLSDAIFLGLIAFAERFESGESREPIMRAIFSLSRRICKMQDCESIRGLLHKCKDPETLHMKAFEIFKELCKIEFRTDKQCNKELNKLKDCE